MDVYSLVIQEDYDKLNQVRLTINEFHGIEYLHLRRYYLDFDEEWKPSNEGIAIAIDFENCRQLLRGLVEIISLAESKEIIEEEFGELLSELYTK